MKNKISLVITLIALPVLASMGPGYIYPLKAFLTEQQATDFKTGKIGMADIWTNVPPVETVQTNIVRLNKPAVRDGITNTFRITVYFKNP